MRHPTQLYLSGANALIFLVLWRLDTENPPENTLFYTQGVLYCAARFVIEFFRETPPPIWGLTLAQWACVAGFTFFAVQLSRLLRPSKPTKPIGAAYG